MQPLLDGRTGGRVDLAGLRARFLPVLAALALGLVILAGLFFPEIRAAITTWNTSTAYGHCYLVLPMALYLIWDRRAVLAAVPLRPEVRWALLALPITGVWLAADLLGIMEGRQLMAIAALEVLFLSVLGRRLFLALLGPLLYLFFLVPFGAFLTPALQHFTAQFTAGGLDLLGIPNFTDDLTIEIPAGTFFVAEACAGLRFLIAAVAFGVFYALLNYRSPVRRAVFIGASIIVPVIANGFRALGIVVLGNILGNAEAAVADHIIYGWVFFSVVMLLLVAAGLPMREPPRAYAAPMSRPKLPQAGPAPIWGAAAACLLVAAGPAIAGSLSAFATQAPMTALPSIALPAGCQQTGAPPALPATRVALPVECEGRSFEIAIQTFPARSTSADLLAERRRVTGELGAEDASYSGLGVSGQGPGRLDPGPDHRAVPDHRARELGRRQAGAARHARPHRAGERQRIGQPVCASVDDHLDRRAAPAERRAEGGADQADARARRRAARADRPDRGTLQAVASVRPPAGPGSRPRPAGAGNRRSRPSISSIAGSAAKMVSA